MNEEVMELKVKSNRINLGVSIIGLILVIVGAMLPPIITQKVFFVSGAVCLLIASCVDRAEFFAFLNAIVLLGTVIAFFHVSVTFKLVLLGIAGVIALGYLFKREYIKTIIDILGCVGLLLLAFGYAVSNPFVYLFGGFFLTIYSYTAYKNGVRIGLIFAILNAIFTVMALIGILRLFG